MTAIAASALILFQTAAFADEARVLFSFDAGKSELRWQIINDGVMGGRSKGSVDFTDNGMRFSGNLSLANNGGFASVRSPVADLQLTSGAELVIRVKGDGREYNLNLYPKRRLVAFSFRKTFRPKDGAWTDIKLPLSQFRATQFGRSLPNVRLDPKQINRIGISISDKKQGAFQLFVHSINVRPKLGP